MSYVYTKGKSGEIDAIRETADIAFATDRGTPFTFLTVMPKIYRMPNHEGMHHLYKQGEQIVAVAGNLLGAMRANGNSYSTSFVGSVSVLPEHQKKGLMVKLMRKIDEENAARGVAFSMLTGNRNRYEYFNYYYTGTTYFFKFNRGNLVHEPTFSLNSAVQLEEFGNTSEEVDALFALHARETKLLVRSRENFVLSVTNHDSKIYKITQCGALVGCLTVNKALNGIEEVVLPDKSLFLSALWRAFELSGAKTLTVTMNGYEHRWVEILLKYCDSYVIGKDLLVNIYDYKKFLQFAFDLNREKRLAGGRLILTVGKENILIEVNEGKVTVTNVEEKGTVLSPKEFVDLFSMDYFVKNYQISPWFPLPIAVINADKF